MYNNYEITKEQIENAKEPKGKTKLLISDVIFKAVFNRERDILLKMMKDTFDIKEEIELAVDLFVFSGLESNASTKSGKTYRSDMSIRLSDKSLILIEMNYRKDKNAIDRNMVQLIRGHNQILKRGTPDSELKKYRIRGLNLNNFYNDDISKPVENYAFCSLNTHKVATLIYSFCNISLVKCQEFVYDINVINLPNAVRWGAILLESDMNKISQILGDDMLTMEEKERLLNTIEDVNNDDIVMQQWMLEENERLKNEGQLSYAREEGEEKTRLEVIKNMLTERVDYNFISKVTGKTVEEIKAIENSIKE